MAQSGSKTLLVDADMRRPRLHKTFNLSNDRGLSSLIIGEGDLKDVVQSTSQERLEVLSCGPIPPNLADYFRPGFQLYWKNFKTYDRVIFGITINPVWIRWSPLMVVELWLWHHRQTREPARNVATTGEVKAPVRSRLK